MQLTIIIVNYNVKYFLEQCLRSVRKAVNHIDAEVMVIDNASTDGSAEYIVPKFPDIHFLRRSENLGYAKANNQCLLMAKGKYILFLNPDTILPEDCLEKCIRFMDTRPDVGSCGVRMLDGSGQFLPESKRGFPSPLTSFYKLSGLTALFPQSRHFASYYLGHLDEKKDHEVDVLTGAFLMSKKEVLDITGGFDEQFFMYGEDIDLSYRIQKAGFKNYYLAQSCIIHFKGESTRKGSLKYFRLFYKAMSIFVRKYYSGSKRWWFTCLIELSIWFRATLSVTRNLMVRKKQASTSVPINTWIIGSEKDIKRVIAILDRQTLSRRTVSHTGEKADFNKAENKSPDEIIFCEGRLSFKKIIGVMKHIPRNISIKIHAFGTDSIVGSDSKNTSGNVLA